MTRRLLQTLSTVLVLGMAACTAATAAVAIPDPAVDAPLASAKGKQTVVLAGGCFWGIQAVFKHVKGVTDARAGYSGGKGNTAHYEMVSTGETGHAESVKVTYDPSQVSFGQLLKVFFGIAHDPTQLNYQGPDHGTQYRSEIFFSGADQERIARAYIKQLDEAKVWASPIVTQVEPLKAFYDAEDYHQDYAVHHPDEPYIARYDLPKVEDLRRLLPNLYVSR